ncbi:MAG: sulfite exporter TauE/SafE family protein [Bacteroidia bacterium]|nr:sulfite exporter TauE/SafE family protein [Bacteroidia bacterium]
MFLLAAITLGFLGSFHCVGMCGPIALSIPVKNSSLLYRWFGAFLYNLGRVFTYSILGLLFGLIGQGFALAGLQSKLSIAVGVLILIGLLFPGLESRIPKGKLYRGVEWVKSNLRSLFGNHSNSSLFLIGVLNGLLPCGLVYMGIAGSIAQGNAWMGSAFMAGFGFGTLPAMLLVTIVRDQISVQFREKVRRLVPIVVGITAIMLILRGMNLGIPYLSPSIQMDHGMAHHSCCHK